MNVVEIRGNGNASLAKALRDLADDVEAGTNAAFVGMVVRRDGYDFVYNCSLLEAVAFSAMLHHHCIENMKARKV